ncbi:tRNA (adenosine(37)-N6)-threonylcarbamoyltransferase complex dimerization subunit type 1 TsaB [Defluviimonas sp. WL0024]|uniref:tRNA (Adenosine(37)-N6)-threonylcarbamoyltransferase complex dimerization subunit type 1 TsaB n=1 Tax=Albidovulum salinarum TaxID=2984153 RepID=A0ABT2X0X8_9RHOB|nr:tRNA (adenosine(37)-N6)-threonylcarbamoyltransferase complex dimerization subunit type 1 TsaB [Defluviimonas sp. WL0024]MCU9847354.1 tRNA (adenosine(37)-N6)-threonylcarbamoyltransferase complex dimerization subunit type 1 TsaB [Defluviimonas sp. WL0024]
MAGPLILAFDTAAAHCAAALVSGDTVLAARAEEMGRGQAERLMPMLEELLAAAGHGWRDLDALGVGIGPGNFTGIRISVAAARGLALALGIPAVGVSGFEAADPDRAAPFWAVIPGPRGTVYAQRRGDAPSAPEILPDTALASLDAPVLRLDAVPADRIAVHIARVAATRWQGATPRPAPLYLRPADAAPARDTGPAILP